MRWPFLALAQPLGWLTAPEYEVAILAVFKVEVGSTKELLKMGRQVLAALVLV